MEARKRVCSYIGGADDTVIINPSSKERKKIIEEKLDALREHILFETPRADILQDLYEREIEVYEESPTEETPSLFWKNLNLLKSFLPQSLLEYPKSKQ